MVGISQACPPASGSTLHFLSTAAAPLPPRSFPALESTSRGKPAIPQTATRWCHKLTTGLLPAPSRRKKRRTGQGVPGDSWAPPAPSIFCSLRCDSGSSRVTLRALFSPLRQVPWFGSYLLPLSVSLLLVSPCSSSSIPLHLPVSPSVSPFSLSSPVLSVFIFLSKSNAASSYTTGPFKEKNFNVCLFIGLLWVLVEAR